MWIIAEETEVDLSEFADDTKLEDFGVDSLFALTILTRFRKKLDLEVPSTLFTDCASVAELGVLLGKRGPARSSDGRSRWSNDTE